MPTADLKPREVLVCNGVSVYATDAKARITVDSNGAQVFRVMRDGRCRRLLSAIERLAMATEIRRLTRDNDSALM